MTDIGSAPESSPGATDVVRIVLVDDHSMLLQAMATALQTDPRLELVATMESVESFQNRVGQLGPVDLIVADLDLGAGRGTDLVQMAQEVLSAPVLLLSATPHRIGVNVAMQSGCAGFVHKTAPLSDLVAAILTVQAGGVAFSHAELRASFGGGDLAIAKTLTERELEVLRQLGQGKSPAEISRELTVSIHTARNHIRSILAKLNATSQLDAVVKAVQQKLIRIGE